MLRLKNLLHAVLLVIVAVASCVHGLRLEEASTGDSQLRVADSRRSLSSLAAAFSGAAATATSGRNGISVALSDAAATAINRNGGPAIAGAGATSVARSGRNGVSIAGASASARAVSS